MNIFILDRDVEKCAEYHQDLHVGKMILETAQLLCTAHQLSLSHIETPYKSTHLKHPCSIWTAQSISNYNWLCELGLALGNEFKYRRGKEHKSTQIVEWCKNNKPPISDLGLTEFAQAMPDIYKQKDPVEAYRDYYRFEKQIFKRKYKDIYRDVKAKWTNREIPYWLKPHQIHVALRK